MERHREAVAAISAQVRHFHEHNTPFRIFHGATNTTRPLSLERSRTVDTSALQNVLRVDAATKTALVEPNVAMDALVAAALPLGLVPPVVLEFPGITVGGAFAGTSGESSSFRHGFFDASVSRVEMVLADGAVVGAGARENADLFAGAAGSFGSLGVVTALELRLVDARDYVEVTYAGVRSVEEALGGLQEAMADPRVDFVDAILFSSCSGAVVTARRTSCLALRDGEAEVKVQSFHRPRDPWFYLHAQRLTGFARSTASPGPSPSPYTELVPLQSYLFRYDRGAFWTGLHAFHYFLVPFTALFRRLLDYFMHTRVMYHALHESGHMDRYILQDCVLPASRAEEFVQWVGTELGIWPLWLCPLKGVRAGESRSFHPYPRELADGDWPLNIGVWGPGPTDAEAFVRVNKGLETKLRSLGGMKWLYAQVFCSEDEFWAQYDKVGYEALREKWHATSLPSVWDKVKRKEGGMERKGWKGLLWGIWPVSGLYGVWRAWGGGEYLVIREKEYRLGGLVVPVLGSLLGILAILWMAHAHE